MHREVRHGDGGQKRVATFEVFAGRVVGHVRGLCDGTKGHRSFTARIEQRRRGSDQPPVRAQRS